MENNNPNQGSIFNIGDLAKPVDTLIQRTSDFLGAVFAPRQLIRMTKAKVEADRIEKLGNVETEIRERALQRLLAEEVRNQENIENIVRQSVLYINEEAKPEELSDDWLALFFDKSKRFSDSDMQNLWAKILAGEANKAGSFSKRTIEVVSTLDKADAELFIKLCSFCCDMNGLTPFIYFWGESRNREFNRDIYIQNGITVSALEHLDDIGLIKYQDQTSFKISDFNDSKLPIKFKVFYYGTPIGINLNYERSEIDVGNVRFTKVGKELAPICNSEKIEDFLEHLVYEWEHKFTYKIDAPNVNYPKWMRSTQKRRNKSS